MEAKRRPFPTFVLWLLVFMLSLLFLMVRCSGTLFVKKPPSITVTAEGQQLNWVVEKSTWNGVSYGQQDAFYRYGLEVSLPSQAAAGEAVSITMDGVLPDQASLREYALEPDGRSAYGAATLLREYSFYFDGKTGSFPQPEPAEHPVRGYLLTCSWGENTCMYALVFQILPE